MLRRFPTLRGFGRGANPRAPIRLVVYGIACTVWRILVLVAICVAAVALLHGIGILLVAITLAGALIPQVRSFRALFASCRAEFAMGLVKTIGIPPLR